MLWRHRVDIMMSQVNGMWTHERIRSPNLHPTKTESENQIGLTDVNRGDTPDFEVDLPPTAHSSAISSLLSGNLVEEWRCVCLRIAMDQRGVILPLLEWAFADNTPIGGCDRKY